MMSVMSTDNREKETENPEPLRNGLYLVATPIGNLRDISLRALAVLKSVDLVICEDTRVTRKLLNAYQISARVQVYNDHSSDDKRDHVMDLIKEGKAVALLSDAGMPLVSDPGYKLARNCQNDGLYVTTIPGANAPLCALQLSGLPSDKFCFLGFMPAKSSARCKVLSEWAGVKATLIAFETAPRLIACLEDISKSFGTREVAVVREITKLYEEVRKDTVDVLIHHYRENGAPKGEIVLVIAPPEDQVIGEDDLQAMLFEALKSMKVKDAAHHVAEKTGHKKSDLYNMALKIHKE
tara:strand:- start:33542 stop:34426 length:885 start_codon:yes stop_codon:yes gene_type:complete